LKHIYVAIYTQLAFEMRAEMHADLHVDSLLLLQAVAYGQAYKRSETNGLISVTMVANKPK
jgi:hypothetical protein